VELLAIKSAHEKTHQRAEKKRPVYLQMIVWGVNALNHSSSIAIFKNNDLVMFGSHADCEPDDMIRDLLLSYGHPYRIYWYERPWLKKARQMRAGQWSRSLDLSTLPRIYLNKLGISCPITYTAHHASHAAAGYYTSPFDRAAVIVLDAIGEFESATIWRAQGGKLTPVWKRSYPNSLGLFYSAFTKLLGFVPVVDESKLQLLARSGDPARYYGTVKTYFKGTVQLAGNLHKGVRDWPYSIKESDRADIAAAVQQVFTEQVVSVSDVAKQLTGLDDLIYMGGCAYNGDANSVIGPHWNNVWTLSDPGDGSSSIGSVLYHRKQRLDLDDLAVKNIALRAKLLYNTTI